MHISDLKRRGKPLSPVESAETPISERGVVWEKWDDPMEPGLPKPKKRLDEEWVSYFPTVPRQQAQTYPYPRPLSEDFWQLYAEPVPLFMTHALRLRTAFQFLAEKMPHTIAGGLDTLKGLLTSISPTLELCKDGSLRQRWSAPSLLASFAMMALQDQIGGDRSILECETCEKVFTSTNYQALYCTDKCRWTAQKRRYRARKETTKGTKE